MLSSPDPSIAFTSITEAPSFVTVSIIILCCLLLMSAFFSLSETAFTSLNEIRIENASVIPSAIHYEVKSYDTIPRDEFDSFVKMECDYLKILLIKGVKYDIFIHPNGKVKTRINPEDEVNGIHIVKEEDLDSFLENKDNYREWNKYKI